MVFVTITLSGSVTDDKYNTIKEKLPQIAEQLGLEGNMNAKYLYLHTPSE